MCNMMDDWNQGKGVIKIIEREFCIAVPHSRARQDIISSLSHVGFRLLGEGSDCFGFMRMLRKVQPHLAVIDTGLPGNVPETVSVVDQECLAAVLLISGNGGADSSVFKSQDLTVLSLPADGAALATVAGVLCMEFSRRKKIFTENRALKNKLQSRAVIEQAKGRIMAELSLEEKQAYRLLQKRSMETRTSMKDVAGEILKKDKLLTGTGF